RGLQKEFPGRVIDPRAVELNIWSHAFEGSGAVEHHRAKPRGVGTRAHDAYVALLPLSLEKCPGFRPAFSDCQLTPRFLSGHTNASQVCDRATSKKGRND